MKHKKLLAAIALSGIMIFSGCTWTEVIVRENTGRVWSIEDRTSSWTFSEATDTVLDDGTREIRIIFAPCAK